MTLGHCIQIAVVVSVLTVLFLTMKKVWWAPIAGIFAQVLWTIYCVQAKAYILLIDVAAFAVIYACSIPKWYKER